MSVNQVDLVSNEYETWSCYCDKINNEIKSIKKQIGGIPWLGKRVLEIGCGTGRFSEKILPDVEKLVAIDIDDSRLEVFRKKIKVNNWEGKCKVLCGELYDLLHELKNEKFDCVLFIWSWRFIYQQGKADKVYNAMKELLASDFSILSTMTIGGEWEDTIDSIVGTKEENREVNQNRIAMKYLMNLFERENLCFLNFIQINYFEFPDKTTAQKFVLEIAGVGLSEQERVGNELNKFIKNNGKVRLSDEIQCLFARKGKWKIG